MHRYRAVREAVCAEDYDDAVALATLQPVAGGASCVLVAIRSFVEQRKTHTHTRFIDHLGLGLPAMGRQTLRRRIALTERV